MATLYNAEEANVICAGASARSLAFSCRRAGLRPATCDLFFDSDLAEHCPGVRIPAGSWPAGLLDGIDVFSEFHWLIVADIEDPKRGTAAVRIRMLTAP